MSKKKLTKWKAEEVALLVQNLDGTADALTRLFPTRSYFSILSKRQKLVQKSLQSNVETPQTSIKFEEPIKKEFIINKTSAIEDINEILTQSLVKVEELTIRNSELVALNKELNEKVVELTEQLNSVNEEYSKQQDKVEELANKSKNKWSLIKTVFFQ